MTKINKTWRTALIAGASLLALAGTAHAQTAPTPEDAQARIQALEAQLELLSGQIADLKAATAASLKDVRAAQSATTVSIAGGKPTIASGDGAFSATLHGVMQLDAGHYFQDKDLPAVLGNARDLNNGTNFRRARIGVDGKIFKVFDYNVLFDFGGAGADGPGSIQEIWLQYNYAPFKVRVGAFAPSLGLEDAASTNGSLFGERPSGSELARGLAGADKRIALQVAATGERYLLAAAVTGAKAGDGQTFDEQLGYTFRAAATPLRGDDWLVHVGVNGSIVAQPAQTAAVNGPYPITISDRPELRVDGQQLISTGALDASGARHYGLELAGQKQNVLIQAEYFDIKVDRRGAAAGVTDPSFKAWYVEGGWVLTGEARKYNLNTAAFDAPVIAKPFDPKNNQWGAWELAGRYSVADLNYHENAALLADRVRGGEQTIWTVGLNWFPNAATKFGLDYQDVDVARRDPANTVVPLSQSYQAVYFRSQFAF